MSIYVVKLAVLVVYNDRQVHSITGKSSQLPGHSTIPLRLPLGLCGARSGCMYLGPKFSNAAVVVRNHLTQKVPEGNDRQTNKKTDFPHIIV